jgi:N6-L-threonylcarbamoyladenine synthase
MLILGIETSCDETSAAVVENGRRVLSNIVASQIAVHAPYGGVVPEIASRHHVEAITVVVAEALHNADVTRDALDAIATTTGPGLAGSLLVGANFARGYAFGLSRPFLPVNHLEGHLHSVWLSRESSLPPAPQLPLLALIVSGGHTELVLMRASGDYEVVGRTLDDAAGEAFDKVARLLGLPYPGGPAIQRVAASGHEPIRLPRAWLPNTFDFSFSGLKTAVLHAVQETALGHGSTNIRGQRLPRVDVAEGLSEQQIANIAAGFQESVVDVLSSKVRAAVEHFQPKSVAIVGGVAANRVLRDAMTERISLPLFMSAPEFSTDNAAMIAASAYFNPGSEGYLDIQPGLELTPA